MEAKSLTPILNVSDIASTVAWFEKWGWKKLWDWGTRPTLQGTPLSRPTNRSSFNGLPSDNRRLHLTHGLTPLSVTETARRGTIFHNAGTTSTQTR